MGFLDTLRQIRSYLQEEGRVSLRALRLEHELSESQLEGLVQELTDVQGVARLEDGVLIWTGDEAPSIAPAPTPERDPRDYTPRHLADRILHSKSAIEGERKQVTVLFADVRRSTELASALDPEDWHAVLDRFFQLLADGVHRFEGTVNQYTGDGIMALFGAPIAHEDHAQRACFAALHLSNELRRYTREVKREHGVDFAVRIGINSGDVVVGKIGDDLRMDYTAQGATVHLAARMQELAEAGRAYLAPATAELARGWFELEDLGEFRVRGIEAPVHVRQLLAVGPLRKRFDLSRSRGLVRFVGRDDELQTLEAALERTRQRNGQVVGVVAEAGTGKSRLCFEFAERCRARGLRVLEGSCVAHGRNLPLLPVLEVVRAYYGITDQDDDRTAREKIAGRMLLLDDSYREALPILFEFLGVPDPERPAPLLPPEARQRQLFAVLRRLTREGPEPGLDVGILLIEDLHWIDSSSQAWIAEWVDACAGAPTLVLLNFRPEYRADWMRRAHYQQLALAPLNGTAIRELLTDLIGSDESTRGLADRIYAHTQGNPFFAEEVVQSLIESGQLQGSRGAYRLVTPVERLEVPASVQAVLVARLDRLPEREKRLLQVASVIGKDFAEPLLAAVAELPGRDLADALAVLRAGEFVYERAPYPVAEYSFKHPLTQAVAQDSLLRERRRALHGAVARAIEAAGGDLDERAALLAHHFERAGEGVLAARWHLRAADHIGADDARETARHARSVIALLRHREDEAGAAELLGQACARLLNLGWRIGLLDESHELYRDGRRWAGAAGDIDAEARVCGAYAAVLAVAGRLQESAGAGAEFIALADRSGDPELRLVSRAWMQYPPMRMGALEAAEPRLLEAIEAGERDPRLGIQFIGSSLAGLLFAWLIDLQSRNRPRPEQLATIERALRFARNQRELEAEAFMLSSCVRADTLAGDTASALAHARQSAAVADALGSPLALCESCQAVCLALVAHGDHATAVERARVGLAEGRKLRINVEQESMLLVSLADAHRGLGELDEALEAAREAIASIERSGARMYLCDALEVLARVQLARDDAEQAEVAIERLVGTAREIGAANFLPHAAGCRAELARLRGNGAARARWLREAHQGFEARGFDRHAARLAAELESL